MTKYAFLESAIDREMLKEAVSPVEPEYRDSVWRDIGKAGVQTGNQVAHSLSDAGYNIARAGNWLLNRWNNNIGPAAFGRMFGKDWSLPEAKWNTAINDNQREVNGYYDEGEAGQQNKELRETNPFHRLGSKALTTGAEMLATMPAGGAAQKAVGRLGGSLVGRAAANQTALGRVVQGLERMSGLAPNTLVPAAAGTAVMTAPETIGTPEQNLKLNGVGARMGWQDPYEYDDEIRSALPLINPEGEKNAVPGRIVRDAKGTAYYATDPNARQRRIDAEGNEVLPGQPGYDEARPMPLRFSRPTTENDARRFALLARDVPEWYQSDKLKNNFRASVLGDLTATKKPWYQSGGGTWDEERRSYYPNVYREMVKDENGNYVEAPWTSRIKHDLPFGENANVSIPLPFGRHLTLDANNALNGAATLGRYNPYAMLGDAAGFMQEGQNAEAARELAGAALAPAMGKVVPYLSKFVPHPILGTSWNPATWWRPAAEAARGAGYMGAAMLPYYLADVSTEGSSMDNPSRADVDAVKDKALSQPFEWPVQGRPSAQVRGVNAAFSGFPRDAYDAAVRSVAGNELADQGEAPAIFSHPMGR